MEGSGIGILKERVLDRNQELAEHSGQEPLSQCVRYFSRYPHVPL